MRDRLKISLGTALVLNLAGVLFIVGSVAYAHDALRDGNTVAAVVAVASAVIYEILVLAWGIWSRVSTSNHYSYEKEALDNLNKWSSYTMAYTTAKAADIHWKYPMEMMDLLTEEERESALEEWEEKAFLITDRFYRMNLIEFPDATDKWYKILIEIRYEGMVPSAVSVDCLENDVGYIFKPLLEYEFEGNLILIKEKIRKMIKKSFQIVLPNTFVQDVCVVIFPAK